MTSDIPSSWQLDHVAHAVSDIDKTLTMYTELFGFTLHSRETLSEHLVEVAFLKLDNSLIEILTPLEGNTSLQHFLQSRGDSLHHLAFSVPSIEEELKILSKKGVQLIDSTPRPGAHNTLISFLHPKSMGGILIELVEHLR